MITNRERARLREDEEPEAGSADPAQGKRQWVYEMNVWTNPTVLITCAKVFAFAAGMPVLLIFLMTWHEDGIGRALRAAGIVAAIVYTILFGLLLFAYVVTGILHRGRYCVVFTMDDEGVDHVQAPRQMKKNQVLGLLGAVMGAAAMNPTVAGAGLVAATHQVTRTAFRDVRRIRVKRRRNVIYLRNLLRQNQVYAEDAHFDDVLNHIIARCPRARVIGREPDPS